MWAKAQQKCINAQAFSVVLVTKIRTFGILETTNFSRDFHFWEVQEGVPTSFSENLKSTRNWNFEIFC